MTPQITTDQDLFEPISPRDRTRSEFRDDDFDFGGLSAEVGGTATRRVGWPQEWRDEAVAELRALLDLPENWDSYGAARVARRSVARGVEVLGQLALSVAEPPEVYATPDGTAEACWEWGGGRYEFELEFLPDGRLRYGFLDREDRTKNREAAVRGWDPWVSLLDPRP